MKKELCATFTDVRYFLEYSKNINREDIKKFKSQIDLENCKSSS